MIRPFPFRINDVEPFIDHRYRGIDSRMKYPGTKAIDYFNEFERYYDYWKEFTIKCIEGCWGYDFCRKKKVGGYRFMPGPLFFHANATWMHHQSKGYWYPDLRDIDWYVFYGFMESMGFSGMDDDLWTTCHEYVRLIESGEELTPKQKMKMKRIEHTLMTPDGKLKRYMDPKEYLYQVFEEPTGKCLYHNETKNFLWLSSRRIGKTEAYKTISKWYITFNNNKTFKEFMERKNRSTVVVASFVEDKTEEVYTKLWESYEMLSELGAWYYRKKTKKGFIEAKEEGCLWHPMRGKKELNEKLVNNAFVKGHDKIVGVGSDIRRVSTFSKDSGAVGGEPVFVHAEEVGLWERGVSKFIGLTSGGQKKDDYFGWIGMGGTGGEIKYAKYLTPIFKNPKSYRIVSYPDKWTKSDSHIACFLSAEWQDNTLRDEHGNLDQRASFISQIKDREEAYEGGPAVFGQHIGKWPLTYYDIFMKHSKSLLPVERASRRLIEIQNKSLRDRHNSANSSKVQVGQIDITDWDKKEVKFRLDPNAIPITRSGMKNEMNRDDHKGAVVLYEPPSEGEDAMYLATYDSIRDSDGTSLCAVLVFKFFGGKKRVTFNVVAEHIYRIYGSHAQDKNDKEAIKLALLYDCKLGPELNLANILTYAEDKGVYDILEHEPMEAIRTMVPGYSGKYGVGVLIVGNMINKCELLAAEILNTKIDEEVVIVEGKEVKEDIKMVDLIDSEHLLDDIMFWEKKGNYDYMSAFFVACIYVKQHLLGHMDYSPQIDKNVEDIIVKISKYKKQKNSAYSGW